MNRISSALDLARNFRRHRAVAHPNTARFAYHWMKGSVELPYGPVKMHIEPTSLCNLRCVMCPQSLDAIGDDFGYMELSLFEKIIEQARGHVREVNLFFRGESLLHKRIFDMIRICTDAGIVSNISTNATMLTEDYSEQLIKAGLGKMTISFDAGQPEMYEKMRQGARFKRTLRNVLQFLHEKRRSGLSNPYVVMQVIQLWEKGSTGLIPEIPPDFIRRFDGLPIDEWDSLWAHGWAGTMGNDGDDYSARPIGPHYFPCNWLWKSMAVYWDGTVPACCADFSNEQIVGNLNDNTLMEVWNGKGMQDIRQAQLSGDLSGYKLCSNCDAIWQDPGSSWKLFTTLRSLTTRNPLPGLLRKKTAKSVT